VKKTLLQAGNDPLKIEFAEVGSAHESDYESELEEIILHYDSDEDTEISDEVSELSFVTDFTRNLTF
jgi:hypothetical protein